jgi:hypothetical protein
VTIPTGRALAKLNQRRAALLAHLANISGQPNPTSLATSYGLEPADVERIIRNRSA